MSDYHLCVRILFVYLHHLVKIYRVAQTQRTRYVKHYDTTDTIHQFKLARSEKVEYSDIGCGDP